MKLIEDCFFPLYMYYNNAEKAKCPWVDSSDVESDDQGNPDALENNSRSPTYSPLPIENIFEDWTEEDFELHNV